MKIAIIPAPKGSKKLINKNVKILDGFPLIVYTFKFVQANVFDRIIVDESRSPYPWRKGESGLELMHKVS